MHASALRPCKLIAESPLWIPILVKGSETDKYSLCGCLDTQSKGAKSKGKTKDWLVLEWNWTGVKCSLPLYHLSE